MESSVLLALIPAALQALPHESAWVGQPLDLSLECTDLEHVVSFPNRNAKPDALKQPRDARYRRHHHATVR